MARSFKKRSHRRRNVFLNVGWNPTRFAVNPWTSMLGVMIFLLCVYHMLLFVPWSLQVVVQLVSTLRGWQAGSIIDSRLVARPFAGVNLNVLTVRIPELDTRNAESRPVVRGQYSSKQFGEPVSLLVPSHFKPRGSESVAASPATLWKASMHHLAAASMIEDISATALREMNGPTTAPMPLCAALANVADGDQRYADRITPGELPNMLCTFHSSVAIGARRQLDPPASAAHADARLRGPLPHTPWWAEAKREGLRLDVHTAALYRDHLMEERLRRPAIAALRPGAIEDGDGEGAAGEASSRDGRQAGPTPDLSAATVLRTYWYAGHHLAHWLPNGYLPTLDHWLNLGAPRPLVLAPMFFDIPLSPNAGAGARTLWPADGFGEHTMLISEWDSWPDILATVAPAEGKEVELAVDPLARLSYLSTAEKRWGKPPEKLVNDLFVARRFAIVMPGTPLWTDSGHGDVCGDGGAYQGDPDEADRGVLCLGRTHFGMPPAVPIPYTPIQIRRRTMAVARLAAWRKAAAAPVCVLEDTRRGGWRALAAGGFVPGMDPELESLFRSRVWAVPRGGSTGPVGNTDALNVAVPAWTGPDGLQQWGEQAGDNTAGVNVPAADGLPGGLPPPRVIRVLWLYRPSLHRSQSNLHQTVGAVLGIAPEDLVLPTRVPWSLANETQGDDQATYSQLVAARNRAEAILKAGRAQGEGPRTRLQPVVLDVRLSTLGRFDFHEQVRLVRAADVLVTVHGNELSNMLWMRGAGSAAIEIQTYQLPNGYFSDIGAAAEGLSYQVYRPQGKGTWLGEEFNTGKTKGNRFSRANRPDPQLLVPEAVEEAKQRSVHWPVAHALALVSEALARASAASVEEQVAQEDALIAMAERAWKGEHCGAFRPDGSFDPRPEGSEASGCDAVAAGPSTNRTVTTGGEGRWDASVLQTGRKPRAIWRVLG